MKTQANDSERSTNQPAGEVLKPCLTNTEQPGLDACCGKPIQEGSPEAWSYECCGKFVRPAPDTVGVTRERLLRCQVTSNPCGTDTWKVGHPCQCEHCRQYLALLASPLQLDEDRSFAASIEALAQAFAAGAMAVHEQWVQNPGEAPNGDPGFGEAARDYALSALSKREARPKTNSYSSARANLDRVTDGDIDRAGLRSPSQSSEKET